MHPSEVAAEMEKILRKFHRIEEGVASPREVTPQAFTNPPVPVGTGVLPQAVTPRPEVNDEPTSSPRPSHLPEL